MSAYNQTLTEARRLRILQILDESPGFQGNDRLIRDQLGANGIPTSLEQVSIDLAWLEAQGALSLRDLGGLTIATITALGQDLAKDRANLPGVARPLPGTV